MRPGVSDPTQQHPSAAIGQLPPGTRMPADCGEERKGATGVKLAKMMNLMKMMKVMNFLEGGERRETVQ